MTGTQHAFIGEKVPIDSAQVWLGLLDNPLGLSSAPSICTRVAVMRFCNTVS